VTIAKNFILSLRALCTTLHETFLRRLNFEFGQPCFEISGAESQGCGLSHPLPLTAHAQLAMDEVNAPSRSNIRQSLSLDAHKP
jgi:hypothetical protein